jgi:hypothetical protein
MGTGTHGRWSVWTFAVGSALLLGACSGSVGAEDEESEIERRDAELSEAPRFLTPANGDEIEGSFTFEIDAGPVDLTGTTEPADAGGRFHVLIDRPCLDNSEAFPPVGDDHLVFEPGATTLDAELAPGSYELCLQFGNAFDIAFYATDTIIVHVE